MQQTTYTVTAVGDILVENQFVPTGNLPPLARVGLYGGKVTDQYFPYKIGNKTDVRWVTITNAAGQGIIAVGEPLLTVNVRDYTDESLLRAKRTQELPRAKTIVVNLDLTQMGLGGDDSWTPRVHPEYQLQGNQTYTYRFRLRPVDLKQPTGRMP
jgi:beta-galactosidase